MKKSIVLADEIIKNAKLHEDESMKKYSSIDITYATKFKKPSIEGFIQEEA